MGNLSEHREGDLRYDPTSRWYFNPYIPDGEVRIIKPADPEAVAKIKRDREENWERIKQAKEARIAAWRDWKKEHPDHKAGHYPQIKILSETHPASGQLSPQQTPSSQSLPSQPHQESNPALPLSSSSEEPLAVAYRRTRMCEPSAVSVTQSSSPVVKESENSPRPLQYAVGSIRRFCFVMSPRKLL